MKPAAGPILFVLALAAIPAGCGDAPTEPRAFLLAAETEAALGISASLPVLPDLVERVVGERRGSVDTAALLRARSLWLDAEASEDEAAARALRRLAYGRAAPALAAGLDAAALREVQATLGRWVRLAGSVAEGAAVPAVDVALADGAALLADADDALGAGRREAAVALLLEAADRLRETTPRAVARRLIRQAEAARAAAPRDGAAVRRAERLLRGAREALDAGDPVRAIRRAYYARQLLGLH